MEALDRDTTWLPDRSYFNCWFVVEAAAVVTGALYTILITYGSIWCWPFAIASSSIFVYLCASKRLYAETALQLFYVAFGIYGWTIWGQDGGFKVTTLGLENNAWLVGLGIFGVGLLGAALNKYTEAKLPYVDSFTTVFSIIGTWLMVHSIFENWIYWIVIDSVSTYMYARRGLYLSGLLFLVYTILAINGCMEWAKLL